MSNTDWLRRARLMPAWLAALALLAAACAKGASAGPPPAGTSESAASSAPAAVARASFAVEGMSCASCAVTVGVAARKLDGVLDAGADAERGRAWARYDPARTSPAAIAKAISEAGYPARPLDRPEAPEARVQ